MEDGKKVVEELEDHYPESTKWGNLPSYGFFIRHAKNVTLKDVKLTYKSEEPRSAIMCDDVAGINLHYLKIKSSSESEAAMQFNNTTNAFITGCSVSPETKIFLKLNGETTNNIHLMNNNLRSVKKVYEIESGLTECNIEVK